MNAWTGSYTIGRPQRRCSATGRVLVAGEKYVAALLDPPLNPPADLPAHAVPTASTHALGKPERRDYALEVWDAAEPQGRLFEPGRLVGAWRSQVATGQEKPKAILDDEAMLDLFTQTQQSGPARAGLRMVLALLLIRRRVLAHEGTRNADMLVRVRGTPRPPQGPPLIHVHDPSLSDTAIAELLGQLESMCQGADEPETAATRPGADPAAEPTTGTAPANEIENPDPAPHASTEARA